MMKNVFTAAVMIVCTLNLAACDSGVDSDNGHVTGCGGTPDAGGDYGGQVCPATTTTMMKAIVGEADMPEGVEVDEDVVGCAIANGKMAALSLAFAVAAAATIPGCTAIVPCLPLIAATLTAAVAYASALNDLINECDNFVSRCTIYPHCGAALGIAATLVGLETGLNAVYALWCGPPNGNNMNCMKLWTDIQGLKAKEQQIVNVCSPF